MVRFHQLNGDTASELTSTWDAVEVEDPEPFGDKNSAHHPHAELQKVSQDLFYENSCSEKLDRECRSVDHGYE